MGAVIFHVHPEHRDSRIVRTQRTESRQVMRELTERQAKVLDYITATIRENGYPPTLREIGQHMGIRSTNGVNDHLRALERKGYLKKSSLRARALTPLVGLHRDDPDIAEVPVLGKVAAGQPITRIEDAREKLKIDRGFLGTRKPVFALEVAGDSMINDGIRSGDYVFVKRQETAEAGQIVVVVLDDEVTVKRYYPERNRIRLQPANDSMRPIYVKKGQFLTTQLLGTVIGVYRRF